jgi:hypothetical protein
MAATCYSMGDLGLDRGARALAYFAMSNTSNFQPMRLDRHPGASRGPSLRINPYSDIHDVAARQDGIVKILTGLMLGVVSLCLSTVGIAGLYALIRNHEFMFWALALGVPGVVMALGSMALVVWGAAKLLSGRGEG